MSALSSLASVKAFSTGIRQRLINFSHNFSKRLLSVFSICFGPVLSAVINGK
jgi:hypothetical protein